MDVFLIFDMVIVATGDDIQNQGNSSVWLPWVK
jgi:hypothetical protein